jgi:hypothetical protein
MAKSQNTVDKIKISTVYYIKPFLVSILITALIILIVFLQKNNVSKVNKLCSVFYDIGITFSLTFTAFAITALALLQLLHEKPWFKEISESIYFKRFLTRFLYTIKMCMVFFVSILFHMAVINFERLFISYISLAIFLVCLIFIVSWTLSCISDFILLFK